MPVKNVEKAGELPRLEVLDARVARTSGNWIISIPLSADPDKDPNTPEGAKWFDGVKRSYAAQQARDPTLKSVEQEYLMQFVKYHGKKVLTNYKTETHHLDYPGFNMNLPLIIGLDYGGGWSAYFLSQMNQGRWIWLDGEQLERTTTIEMCNRIIKRLNDPEDWFFTDEELGLRIIGDYAGTIANPQGNTTTAAQDVHSVFGITPESQKISVDNSIDKLNQTFNEMTGGLPVISVNPHSKRLKNLLEGGYHYRDNPGKLVEEHDGEGYIHIGTAIRYVYWHLFQLKVPDKNYDMPEYNFKLMG